MSIVLYTAAWAITAVSVGTQVAAMIKGRNYRPILHISLAALTVCLFWLAGRA